MKTKLKIPDYSCTSHRFREQPASYTNSVNLVQRNWLCEHCRLPLSLSREGRMYYGHAALENIGYTPEGA